MKSTQRIGLLLTLVFLLPALFYSAYELTSLDEDEKMIQEIYDKQLESILFSANQYADDIIGNWISKIEIGLEKSLPDSMSNELKSVLNLNSALTGVFLMDTLQDEPALRKYALDGQIMSDLWGKATQALTENRNLISQLLTLQQSGFQKVERVPFTGNEETNLHCLLFTTQQKDGFRVAGIFIDANFFIEDIVGPKLQSIAKEQFLLSVLRKDDNTVVYSTIQEANEELPVEAVTREFWILPEYTLGISAKGNTVEQLIRERTKTNMVLIAALDFILIIAVILVFRNLKKEVNLAQNKADFVSNVSHEIRTPLALISMFAETLELKRVPTEEKKQEYYSIISKEAQRLTGIVNKILNFSQTEALKKRFHIEELAVDSEVMSILTTYDFHLRNKGFDYTYAKQSDLKIRADKQALVEAIINLIDNAMKYSDEKKYIEVTSGREGEFGFISIKDQGVGISKRDQKHIFDKFYRVSSGNLAKSRGTGLGLSLVRQLMESQKGKITVTSELGTGSQFTLYFPLA